MIRTLLLALVLVGRIVLAAEEHDHDHDAHAETEAGFVVADFERSGVRLATVGPGEIDLGVELPGEVRPNADRIAHVAARFPGIVREVRKQVGDTVRADDVLAVVESEHLASFDVRAAFDGTVIDKHIAPGEAVDRDEPAFIIADLSTVWVTISVYQSALADVRIGQPVVIQASHGNLEATGRVAYISPVVDQATRTASARVVLPNPDGAWRPGVFVTATIFDPVAAAVVVPRRAVQTLNRRSVVFVVDGDRFAARDVVLGRSGRTKVEIVSGIVPGDRIADERSFLVKAELAKGAAEHHH
jgi:cobalt-zinc-cadmium efflux system membrane fusion protein